MIGTEFISITASTSNPVYFKATYQYISQNISNKTSTFRLRGYIVTSSSGGRYSATGFEAQINGTTIRSRSSISVGAGETLIGSTDVIVSHNPNTGVQYRFDINAYVDATHGFSNRTGSGWIPQGTAPTQSYTVTPVKLAVPGGLSVTPTTIARYNDNKKSVTISWNGVSGNVSGYQIWGYTEDWGETIGTRKWINLSGRLSDPNQRSWTWTVNQAVRSSSANLAVFLKVEALSKDGTDYDSGRSGNETKFYLNNIPESPIGGELYVASNQITFSHYIAPGSTKDNSQSIASVYYSEIENGNKVLVSQNILTADAPAINTPKTYYLYTYDNYDYSESATLTVKRAPQPEITNLEVTSNIDQNNYIVNATATSNYDTGSGYEAITKIYTWTYKINSGNEIVINGQTNRILNNFNLTSLGIKANDSITISVKFNTGLGEESNTESYTITIPGNINIGENNEFKVVAGEATSTENYSANSIYYYNEMFKFIFDTDKVTQDSTVTSQITYSISFNSPDSGINNYVILPNFSSDGSQFNTDLSATGNNFSLSSITRGAVVNFKLTITNGFDVIEQDASITRISLPSYNGNLSASTTEIKPYFDKSSNILFTFVKPSSLADISPLSDNLKVVLEYENYSIFEESFSFFVEESGSSYSYTWGNSNIVDFFEDNYNNGTHPLNQDFTNGFNLYALDAFGNKSTISSTNVAVRFIEPPTANLTLTPTLSIRNITLPNTNSEIENKYKIMVVDGDSLNIQTTGIFSDLNNDISQYVAEIAYENLPESSSISEWEEDHVKGLTFNTFIESSSSYLTKTINENQEAIAWIRIKAVDSKGNSSGYVYHKAPLIFCKNNGIKVNIIDMRYMPDPDNEELQVLRVYYNITDTGTNSNSNFNNLYRGIYVKTDTTLEPTIAVFLCNNDKSFVKGMDISFSSEIDLDTYINGTYIDFEVNSEETKLSDKEIVTLDINIQSIAEFGGVYTRYIGLSPFYRYTESSPTVSHRAHHVGINFKDFAENDVFVIKNHSNRDEIRLIFESTDPSEANKEIKIDLSTGAIDGAIINGGTWDI